MPPRSRCPAALGGLLALHAVPALVTVEGLRRRLLPGLSGVGPPGHVALTFDDGPDRRSTPHFLRLLARARVRATFFLLGSMLDRDHGLGREIAAGGHELAVHGWEHHNPLLRPPWAAYAGMARTRDLIAAVTGQVPRWYRPPYGALTGGALVAGVRLDLEPRLWTAWGRDWEAHATPESIHRDLLRTLAPGGTVLLHDCDCTSAPGAWRRTLGALPMLLDWAAGRGVRLGPLSEHRPPPHPAGTDARPDG